MSEKNIEQNPSGKSFKPKRFGPQPIISSSHGYDDQRPQTFWYQGRFMSWLDVWLLRGGSLDRDSVIRIRAANLPDLRNFDEQLRWDRLLEKMRYRRRDVRQKELVNFLKQPKFRVVK